MPGTSSTTDTMTLPGTYVIRPFQSKPMGKLRRTAYMMAWGHYTKAANAILAVLVGIPMFGAALSATHYAILVITKTPYGFAHLQHLSQHLPEYFIAGIVMAAMGLVFLVRYSEEEPLWIYSLFFGVFGGLVLGFAVTYPI